MTAMDPVALVRAAITERTGLATTRVLDMNFTDGPMPVVHVHHITGVADDIDRTDTVAIDVYHSTPAGPGDPSAASVAGEVLDLVVGHGITTGAGLIDEIAVNSVPVTRPYHELIEVAAMVLDVTHRPTD